MVATPGEYRWSSYHANAAGAGDPLVRFHPENLRLGPDPVARQRAYRTLFDDVLRPERELTGSEPLPGTGRGDNREVRSVRRDTLE